MGLDDDDLGVGPPSTLVKEVDKQSNLFIFMKGPMLSFTEKTVTGWGG